MGFFSRFLGFKGSASHAESDVLILAPAVLGAVLAGKDCADEQSGLAKAVEKLHYPEGFNRDRTFAAIAELRRHIAIEGAEGMTYRIKSELTAAERADALRLALVAAYASRPEDPDDPIVLARVATDIGVETPVFAALSEAAQRVA